MSDMKPCPCCGSQNIATRNWWNSLYETRYFAECYDCGCLVGFMADPSGWVGAAYDTEAEAIEAWNTRHERTCKCESYFNGYNLTHVCTGCGYLSEHQWNYCPNCGAKVVE